MLRQTGTCSPDAVAPFAKQQEGEQSTVGKTCSSGLMLKHIFKSSMINKSPQLMFCYLPSLTVAVSCVSVYKPDSDAATEEMWLSNECIEAKISSSIKIKKQQKTSAGAQ